MGTYLLNTYVSTQYLPTYGRFGVASTIASLRTNIIDASRRSATRRSWCERILGWVKVGLRSL